MTDKQKAMRNRIIISAILFAAVCVVEHIFTLSTWLILIAYVIPYLIVASPTLLKAAKNISKGRVFDERFLMCIATIAAFIIGEYSEGVAAMLFYQVGELFEDYAVNRSRRSIAELMSIAPEFANIEKDGVLTQIDPDDVEIGTVIVIKPGEKVPIDGVVVSGESMLDTSAITGESVKRSASEGDEIFSGCVNGSGLLHVRTTKLYEDSTVAKILELVEDASSRKTRVENFITKFARYYTPAVVIFSVLLAIFVPLILGETIIEGIRRACIFLVVSCPCALVISVPLSFFSGIGAASRYGILVKGSNFLEALSRTDTFVFDKTGTLTKGEFKVQKVFPEENADEILKAAAMCEEFSNHPIADSIKAAYGKKIKTEEISDTVEIPGRGVSAKINNEVYLAGSDKLMSDNNISFTPCKDSGTVVYIACQNKFIGYILISDTIKDGAAKAISNLRSLGIKNTVMLTGDTEEAAASVGKQLGIDTVLSRLLPADKAQKVEELLKSSKGTLAFAGDGINDAPVLMRSDIGIAMGSLGSDAAIEAADVVLMDDDLKKLALIIKISKKTVRIAGFNIVFALVIKFGVLALGALGIANMWLAIFADVGVAVLAILNAMRTLKVN